MLYDVTDRYVNIDADIKARILNIIAYVGPTTVLLLTGNVIPSRPTLTLREGNSNDTILPPPEEISEN